ncbi:MAG: YaiO family outer membrane beta-barrel protein [Chitinophagaceae bacterium]|nr:YaiO family outer membrane beta-barrel protein [Chitinophagaceae bacterium]
MCGQTTIDSDAEFQKARTLAFSGKRAEARVILRNLLVIKPANSDAQILLARTYSWDSKYDSARIQLNQVLSYSDKNEDATNALIDVELWSDNYNTALEISNKALKDINPRSEDFLLKKARALSNLNNYKEADSTLQALLKINPKNEKAISALETVKRESRVNKIGVGYEYEHYSTTFTPWHMVSPFYSRKTKYLGTVIGRINYAYRFDEPGIQYEVDMYPKLTKNMYSYFNVGYSKDDIFPDFRFGFSLYRNLPKSWEAEIGLRYLKFTDPTIIYVGSISKYISNYWFSLRPSFIPDKTGNSLSFSFLTRYYFADADNYFTLTLGSGLSPNEFARNTAVLGKQNLKSKKIGLGFQHKIFKRFLLSSTLGYRKDEYQLDLFRDNISFSTGIEMFF